MLRHDDSYRRELRRLFAASFAADLQLYLVYTAVPFKALRLGADPLLLGLLAAASTGTYALVVPFTGHTSDRVPRLMLARICCLGVILACIGLTMASSLGRMLAWMPLLGASMACFWPSVQASIADRARPGALEHDLGRFNLSWSLGKGSGFLFGGILLSAFGAPVVFTIASLLVFAIFCVLPIPNSDGLGPIDALLARDARRRAGMGTADSDTSLATAAPRAGAAPPVTVDAAAIDARALVFRRLAWAANCTAYGVAASLIYHYPRVVAAHGWSTRVFGVFLGGIYFTQTLAFLFMMRRPDTWRFQRARLYLPQLAMLAALVALPFADQPRLAIAAPVYGAGLGICYYSSIYYSLLAPSARGRNAGVHEALIGLGGMVVPLAGGILARAFGAAWLPYAVAAAGVALSLLLQEALYQRGVAVEHRVGSK